MASPELKQISDFLRAMKMFDSPIEESRAKFEMSASRVRPSPEMVVEPTNAGGVPAEWLRTLGGGERGVILYLHGGGYRMGSIRTHRDLAFRMARASGCRALVIDYRLAPEHPFPAALEDAQAAYRWLLADGCPRGDIVVAGDSAGGGLVVALLVKLRDDGAPLPAAAVCLSPWVDLTLGGESVVTRAELDPILSKESSAVAAGMYLGGADPRHPLASPLYADLRGLPPLLIQVGTAEVLHDDAVRLAARAREAGVRAELEIWEDMIHIWQFFAFVLPEGRQAIERIGEFIRVSLSHAETRR
jgi:acetyl esterase/lipase